MKWMFLHVTKTYIICSIVGKNVNSLAFCSLIRTFVGATNHNIVMRKSFLLLLALAGFCVADAKIVLPQMFQSGMVLQRGKPIPIWGKADPKEQVVIRWQKKQYTTVADDQGRWRIDLPKTKAGGPYTLVVDNQELTDVLVGDVWLCSGQSNIDVTIERVYPQYVDEIDHFDNPSVRLFRVQNETNAHGVQDDIRPTSINWKPLTKQNAWLFSALGSFLGKRMQEKTGVPQGVIVNSWGGTPIEAWIAADSLEKDNPKLLQKTRLYDNKEYVAAQMRANNLADRRWNEMLDQQDAGMRILFCVGAESGQLIRETHNPAMGVSSFHRDIKKLCNFLHVLRRVKVLFILSIVNIRASVYTGVVGYISLPKAFLISKPAELVRRFANF